MITEQMYRVHFQSSRQIFVKLEILNQNDIVLDSIEGELIDGNVSGDAESNTRRTCDIQLYLKQNFLPKPNGYIWLNKRFKLWIGILDILTDEIVWFDQGVYLINNPTTDLSINNKTINIKGVDKMHRFTQTQLGALTKINANTPISQAIKSIMQLSGETKLLIDTIEYNTPYDIEKSATDTIWSLLEELNSFYMGWELFYDIKGVVRYQKVKNRLFDSVIFDFKDYDFSVSKSNSYDFDNIKNQIKIIGKLLEDGTQPSFLIDVKDSNYPNSPFTQEKLGEIKNLVVTEDKYFTEEACRQRCEHELWKHGNFNEQIDISGLPLYFMDVNKVLYLKDNDLEIDGKYCVLSYNYGLQHNSMMTVNAYKIY